MRLNKIVCPKCENKNFHIEVEKYNKLEEIGNRIGDYFYFYLICSKCKYKHKISMGSD